MTKKLIKLGPIGIEEAIEQIPEPMKATYKTLPYINLEKAKNKYKYKID